MLGKSKGSQQACCEEEEFEKKTNNILVFFKIYLNFKESLLILSFRRTPKHSGTLKASFNGILEGFLFGTAHFYLTRKRDLLFDTSLVFFSFFVFQGPFVDFADVLSHSHELYGRGFESTCFKLS